MYFGLATSLPQRNILHCIWIFLFCTFSPFTVFLARFSHVASFCALCVCTPHVPTPGVPPSDTLYLFYPGEYILGALLYLLALFSLRRDLRIAQEEAARAGSIQKDGASNDGYDPTPEES